MPALELDVALVHLNRADRAGNAACLGEDLYIDDLFVRAAERAYVELRAGRRRPTSSRRWRTSRT